MQIEMTTFENLSPSQKVRASLHRDVRGICTETLHLLGMDMTKPAMEIVAELVYKKLKIYGTDLEAFAKHAKRNTVNSEDVKLLVRRNTSLKSHLNKIQPSNPLTKDKRRKTIATTKLTTPSSTSKSKEIRPPEDSHLNQTGSKSKETRPETRTEEDETERDVETNEREDERKDDDDSIEKRMANEVEQMSVDDIVDLTFD
ncbi:centromere protein S-like [Leguminivora glycinivorella]|uniref:centromere protein S-like n=1 Tax=Leguminivora glycinivorella TaxID=1035111 RepID=UPI00200E6123|nr:centromere protein S-like [Leguminivora glycinivorella]